MNNGQAAQVAKGKEPKLLHCSFCDKTQNEVKKLIAAPADAFICDECVILCVDIIFSMSDLAELSSSVAMFKALNTSSMKASSFLQEVVGVSLEATEHKDMSAISLIERLTSLMRSKLGPLLELEKLNEAIATTRTNIIESESAVEQALSKKNRLSRSFSELESQRVALVAKIASSS